MILQDATASRDDVLENLQKDTEAKLAASKAAIEREVTEVYNRELTKTIQQKESVISKTTVSARKSIITARNELMSSVIAELTERLRTFSNSPEYEPWLMKNIEEAMSVVHSESALITLTPDDMKRYREKIAAHFPNLAFSAADSGMIGGSRTAVPDENIFIDNSIENKIACCREELFAISGLKLEES